MLQKAMARYEEGQYVALTDAQPKQQTVKSIGTEIVVRIYYYFICIYLTFKWCI